MLARREVPTGLNPEVASALGSLPGDPVAVGDAVAALGRSPTQATDDVSKALDHPLVAGYLRELDSALVGLPARAATELSEQLPAHLREADRPFATPRRQRPLRGSSKRHDWHRCPLWSV
jgi:hypothetical protein